MGGSSSSNMSKQEESSHRVTLNGKVVAESAKCVMTGACSRALGLCVVCRVVSSRKYLPVQTATCTSRPMGSTVSISRCTRATIRRVGGREPASASPLRAAVLARKPDILRVALVNDSYYNAKVGDVTAKDAAWVYEDPKPGAAYLKGYWAFCTWRSCRDRTSPQPHTTPLYHTDQRNGLKVT